MIIEYAYSQSDLKKKCFGCEWLKLYEDDDWYGRCECPDNKVKVRERSITSKKCVMKKEIRKENQ